MDEDDRYATDEIVAVIRDAVHRPLIPTTAYRRVCERIEPEREIANGLASTSL